MGLGIMQYNLRLRVEIAGMIVRYLQPVLRIKGISAKCEIPT